MKIDYIKKCNDLCEDIVNCDNCENDFCESICEDVERYCVTTCVEQLENQ